MSEGSVQIMKLGFVPPPQSYVSHLEIGAIDTV